MKTKINFLGRASKLLLGLTLALFLNSCEDMFTFDLPEANSKVDTVPPTANFSYASKADDFTTVQFNNLSFEATKFLWDFGGGATSTAKDPSFKFAAGEGTYPVTLTASDAKGASDTKTIQVEVVEGPFQPIIMEAGFEDNTLPDGSGDGRDSWRADWSDERPIFGISSSPVTFGKQAAKLEVSSARQGYQEITVEPNTNYDLGFWYTMANNSSDPWAIVAIVGVTEHGPIGSIADAEAGIIASITVNDTSSPSTYVKEKLSFNSGINNTIGIYFYNDKNVETRFDDFTIEIGIAGAVPPSAGFGSAQSSSNYLEYSFTNTSTNATSYLWDFGDGTTSTEVSPTHVYATHNVYTVKLTATNASGKTASLSKTIDIQAPVTADFTLQVDALDYRTYTFTDASVGAVSLLWEFGDGFQFTGTNPTHTYTADAIYTVKLTATSVTGKKDVKTESITVSAGFIAAINEPGIENGTAAWRNTVLETNADTEFGFDGTWVVQTSSTKRNGAASAKLPTHESQGNTSPTNRRWIYQAITVQANTNYTISWYMQNKDANSGAEVTAQIRNAPFDDAALVDTPGATLITSQVYNAASGHDVSSWTLASISFNSGSSTEIVLFIFNDYTLNVTGGANESETFFDDFHINTGLVVDRAGAEFP